LARTPEILDNFDAGPGFRKAQRQVQPLALWNETAEGPRSALAIVTISRGSGSGGLLLAERLADELGYEVVSREDIIREAATFGAPEEGLQDALLKPPGFWDRFKHERRRYLAFVQAALCEHAQRDRIIYHGNAGHLLLTGVAHVLCVRIIAPKPFRVQMLMERQKMGREEALDYIEKADRQREQWTRFLYGVDWLDPNLYDLTVNLRSLDITGVAALVAAAVRDPRLETTEASRKAMADLVLASRVRAALAANAETASAEVNVRAEDGVVYLKGKLRLASMVDPAVNLAGNVEGVRRVDRKQLDAPDYTV
jgi:cytidylate kinase